MQRCSELGRFARAVREVFGPTRDLVDRTFALRGCEYRASDPVFWRLRTN